jgi:hypothetical protein
MNILLTLNLEWTVLAVLWLIIIAASFEISKREAGRTAVLVQKLSLHRNIDFGILKELQLFSSNVLVLMSALQILDSSHWTSVSYILHMISLHRSLFF